MERRRNSGAVRLKVVSGGPSSSPSSSSIFLCFFFSFIPLFFSFFFSFGLQLLPFSVFSYRSFSPLLVLPLSFLLPICLCIYRQRREVKIGRDMVGAVTVLPPHDCPRRHVSSVSPTCGRPRVS
jgi:hypothetical protein